MIWQNFLFCQILFGIIHTFFSKFLLYRIIFCIIYQNVELVKKISNFVLQNILKYCKLDFESYFICGKMVLPCGKIILLIRF